MKKLLTNILHIIIPVKESDNIPHILKEKFIIVLVVFLGLVFHLSQNNLILIKNLNLTGAVYPAVLADMANKDRAIASGAEPLSWSKTLEEAARLKAEDMIKNNYFAHTSPSGITPWYWLEQAGYKFSYAGENLGMDFIESGDLEVAWINSPKHKENILNPNYKEVGIASLSGFVNGRETTVVVEFFGTPANAEAALTLDTGDIASQSESVAVSSTENSLNIAGASVQNDANLEKQKDKNKSNFIYRFMINPSGALIVLYTVMFGVIMMSVLCFFCRKIQNHQKKNVVMGLALMLIITTCLYFTSMLGVSAGF